MSFLNGNDAKMPKKEQPLERALEKTSCCEIMRLQIMLVVCRWAQRAPLIYNVDMITHMLWPRSYSQIDGDGAAGFTQHLLFQWVQDSRISKEV